MFRKIFIFAIGAIITLLHISIISRAQKIHFTDSTNVWTYAGVRGMDPSYLFETQLSYRQDSIVDGVTYRNMNDVYLIREDTTTHRVYCRVIGMDSTDRLLYRYDLNVGDTVHFDNSLGGMVSGPFIDSVVSIDSTLIDGVYHKVFTLQDTGYYDLGHGFTYVEGLGGLAEPLLGIYVGCGELAEKDVCFSQAGVYPYINVKFKNCYAPIDSFVNSSLCTDPFLSVKSIAGIPDISINPNPFSNTISVRITNNDNKQYNINVRDVVGKTIYSDKMNDTHLNINTGAWQSGFYILNIQNEVSTISKKIMKQ